jgi:membrane peptidoglycan carboxypeptidase
MEAGTGIKYQLDNMPSAGKTGTTNDYKDGWFVGYTRYYTTSVWVGYDMPKAVEELKNNSYPGRIWQSFMNELHQDLPVLDFLPYAQLSDEFQETQEAQRQQEQERRNGGNTPQEEEADAQPEDADAQVEEADAQPEGADAGEQPAP